jgi:hypothetical protein
MQPFYDVLDATAQIRTHKPGLANARSSRSRCSGPRWGGPARSSFSPRSISLPKGIVIATPTYRGLPDLGELEIEHGLRAISHDLTKKFTGRLSPETVDRFVRESFTLMDRTATIRVHLVALTRRFAWDRLTALEKVQNAVATGVPEVLFVCVHNGCAGLPPSPAAALISKPQCLDKHECQSDRPRRAACARSGDQPWG